MQAGVSSVNKARKSSRLRAFCIFAPKLGDFRFWVLPQASPRTGLQTRSICADLAALGGLLLLFEKIMATQNEIADHLDMSVTRLKELLPRLPVTDPSDIDSVRVAYINQLRSTAAGRGGEDHQLRLAIAKARESELKGDRLEMDMARDAGQLVPADELEQEWTALIASARAELMSMVGKLRAELLREFDIDVPAELIESYVHPALEHLANTGEPEPEEGAGEDQEELAPAAEDFDD